MWLRGAAVAAVLAGVAPADAALGFADHDAECIREAMRRFRSKGDRQEAARAIASERMELVHGARGDPGGGLADVGALVVASVLRGLSAGDRTRVIRSFDATLLRAAARRTSDTVVCRASAVLLVIARTVSAWGRPMSAAEVGGLAAVFTGILDAQVSARVHGAARWARVTGLDPGVFAPFEPALQSCARSSET